jgi:hypothetical protein
MLMSHSEVVYSGAVGYTGARDTRDHGNRQIQAEFKKKAVQQIVGR